MYELVFNTKIAENGNLYCPKEFLFENANYKVIVNVNDDDSDNLDVENSAILDNSEEFLSKEEVNYYLNLD
jgi:hypothetical protein